MKYFAYGSNMLFSRLSARVPSAVFLFPAFARHYQLAWDKISSDGSGKCTLVPVNDSKMIVYGGIFRIDDNQIPNLDRAEGCGYGYDRQAVYVCDSKKVHCVTTYIAPINFRDASLVPYDWYHALVMAGARELDLPHDYVERLANIPCMTDPNATRRRKELDAIANDI